MRVMLAVHAYPPRSTAGVEVYTSRLARALASRGHRVRVLTAAHDLSVRSGTRRERRDGEVEVSEVVNTRERGGLRDGEDDPAVASACLAVLAEADPDVVHLQHLLDLPLALVPAASRAGAPVLLTIHDYWLGCARDGLRRHRDGALCHEVDHAVCARCLADSPHVVPPLQRGLVGLARSLGLGAVLHRVRGAAPRGAMRALGAARGIVPAGEGRLRSVLDRRAERIAAMLPEIAAFVAPTRFAGARAIERDVPAERVRVVPHGVSLAPVDRSPASGWRLGYVGGLAEHKGVHVLVEAFRGLDVPSATLTVHGDATVHAEYAARLRRLAAGDPRIRFAGPFPEGGQAAALAALDAVAVPSLWWENSPFALLEARAAGAWVVASDTGGVPEILPDGAGRLVPPGDVAALRHALAEAAGREARPAAPPPRALEDEVAELESLYAELSSAGRRRAEPA